MTISPRAINLSEPVADDPVSESVLEYFRTRNKLRAFECVHDEFERSGLHQTILAARLRKAPDQVSRLLGAPGNWTLDTLSDLLFAISGAEAKYEVLHPLRETPHNRRAPPITDPTSLVASPPSERPPLDAPMTKPGLRGAAS